MCAQFAIILCCLAKGKTTVKPHVPLIRSSERNEPFLLLPCWSSRNQYESAQKVALNSL